MTVFFLISELDIILKTAKRKLSKNGVKRHQRPLTAQQILAKRQLPRALQQQLRPLEVLLTFQVTTEILFTTLMHIPMSVIGTFIPLFTTNIITRWRHQVCFDIFIDRLHQEGRFFSCPRSFCLPDSFFSEMTKRQ